MKLFNGLAARHYKRSYSQCGEDLIVEFILDALKISKPSYLDIGAHHPTFLSNTYLFYRKGGHGVCIEPDPVLCRELKGRRRRDICLNVGIGITQEDEASFYILSSRALSTFSREEAERYQGYGHHKIEQVIRMPLVPVNDIIRKYFSEPPRFVSLDTEGMDLAILKTFDFGSFRPPVFCVETLTYTEDKLENKIPEIIDLMVSKGYRIYADTFINSIFVDEEAWNGR